MLGSGENGATQLPSVFSWIGNCAPSSAFSSRPLPASLLSLTTPQAVPLSQALSQMRLFSPAPYLRRSVALTRSGLLQEGLTEQWSNEQWPNIGCTQVRPLDPLLPVPQDCGQVPAHPRKCLRDSSSSVSGIMENHSTHLAPGFTLNDLP